MYKKYSLDELYDTLKKFHLSDALHVIGAVNACMRYGPVSFDFKNIPAWIVIWMQHNAIDEGARRSLSICMTRMARFLLLSGANDHKGIFLDLNGEEFKHAYKTVIDLHDPDIQDEYENIDADIYFNRYFGRVGQWQFPLQQSVKTIIGRGYQLFIEIPLAVQTGYDMEAKMQQHFKMTPLQCMLTGYAMWLLTKRTVHYQMIVEIPALQNLVTATSQRSFLQLSSGTATDYRKEIRGEKCNRVNKLKEIYGLDPFVKIPAIAVQRSSHLSSTSYVVPQARNFLDRASSGIFYLLGDKEMEVVHQKGNPFRIAFGKIYREYVGKQLAQIGNKFLSIWIWNRQWVGQKSFPISN